MTPVDQTRFSENGDRGDCQSACIASLLNMDMKDVPYFYEKNDTVYFFRAMNRFLALHGLVHLETSPVNFHQAHFKEAASCYHMIYGESPRGVRHAVVALNGEIVHDPHPSRAGLDLEKADQWTFGWLVKGNS